MKTFFTQYLMTWIKFLVMIPGLVFTHLSWFVNSLYSLFAAALLGDGKTYNKILNDIFERMDL